MSKPIIKYKTFKRSSEFEDFQTENNINIFNIIPIPRKADISFDAEETGDIYMDHGVFVTYHDLDL